jgi:hypothetical protein
MPAHNAKTDRNDRIRELHAKGVGCGTLGKQFGLSRDAVRIIVGTKPSRWERELTKRAKERP